MRHELTWTVTIALAIVGCASDSTTTDESSGGTSAVAGSAATEVGSAGSTAAGSSGLVGTTAAAGTFTQSSTATEGGAVSVTTGGTVATGGAAAAAGACAVTYYRDADGDTWGASESSCTGGVGWVTRAGDCNDANANVFPTQSNTFDAPYTSSTGTQSFDYNCDGAESTAGSSQVSTGACAPAGAGNACTGDGYLPVEPARAGTNLNQICGSMRYLVCARSQQDCIGAVSADGTYQAARCR